MKCVREAPGDPCPRVSRTFHVTGIDGSWPTCGRHGKEVFMTLARAFPGHGLFTRKVGFDA